MNQFRSLLAEQSSPAEVLAFLAIAMVAFLVVTFLIYLLIMLLLKPALPRELSMRRVLFPPGSQLRSNLGEYLLASGTSLLLTLTLFAKSDVVDQIANYDMGQVDRERVASLFDFGLKPELSDEIERSSLNEVVKPMLSAGRVEQANLLVRGVIAQGVHETFLTPAVLVGASLVLAAVYLGLLARRRYKSLKDNPDSAPQYAGTFRSLLALAFCVGLLLASTLPLAEGGERMLAASTLESIAHDMKPGAPPSDVSRLIAEELEEQLQAASHLYCPDCEEPDRNIWELVEEGSGDSESVALKLRAINAELEKIRSEQAAVLQALGADRDRAMNDLNARLADLNAQLQAMMDRFQRMASEDAATLDQVASLAGGVAAVQGGLEEMGESLRRVQAENQRGLEQMTARHERDLQSMGIQLQRAERDAERAKERVAAARSDLRALVERVETLEGYHSRVVQ